MKIKALLIIFVLFLLIIPPFAINAEGDNRIEIDLLEDRLLTISDTGTHGSSGQYGYAKARDGVASVLSCWITMRTNNENYQQVEFDDLYELTRVVFTMRPDDGATSHAYARTNFEIKASNDPSFITYDTLASYTSDPGYDEITVAEITDGKYYKYLRFQRTDTGNYLAVSELKIFAYSDPYIVPVVDLTKYPDMRISAKDFYIGGYTPVLAVDGDTETEWKSGSESSWLHMDLRRKNTFFKIRLLPSDGTADFRITASDDHEFKSGMTLYSAQDAVCAENGWLEFSGFSSDRFRYVRIYIENEGGGIREVEIYAEYQYEALSVTDMEASPDTIVLASPDNIIYDLGKICPLSEIAFLPKADAQNSFTLSGSTDGVSYSLILSAESIKEGEFTFFNLDDEEYRYLKIEKADETEALLFDGVKIISNNMGMEVISASPEGGSTGVTNAGYKEAFVEIGFSRSVSSDTFSPSSVVIVPVNGSSVNYKNFLTEGNIIKIPLTSLESNREYTVYITSDICSTAGVKCVPYEFSFTTGNILSYTFFDGTPMINIALKKSVVSSGTHNATQYYESKLVDGNEGVSAIDSTLITGNSGGRSYAYIDLGNYYDIRALQWVTRYASSSANDYNGVIIAGSSEDTASRDFDTGMTRLYTMSGTEFTNANNTVFTMKLPQTNEKIRYIAIYRDNSGNFFGAAEFRAFTQTDYNFGSWSVEKGNDVATVLSGAGEYSFKLPVASYLSDNEEFLMILCAYDSDGIVQDLSFGRVISKGAGETTMTASITVTASTAKLTGMLVKDINNTYMYVDSVEVH